MCGFIAVQSKNVKPKELHEAISKLSHRGPDDEGIHYDKNNGVGLAHCRLSIIDVAGGKQPMTRGDVTVLYNGEIYNYKEIRKQLKQHGYTFKTESDTEVLLQAYREWGTNCISEFRGMFSFVIWDENDKKFFLARDRFGQKPLFYSQSGDRFFAASEIQSLLQMQDISRRINPNAIPLYLGLQYIPSPHSGFQDIKKLQPGHFMIVENGSIVSQKKYWNLNYIPKRNFSFTESKERVKRTLRQSVRLRMRSDVPIGAFLSGGIDSSIVVALMNQFTDKPVKTFSIGFDFEEFNELPFARQIADRYETDHTEFNVTADINSLLPELVKHYGEPFADSSSIPAYYVSRETSREVKVALTGDGGDELFAGYSLYQYMGIRDSVNRWIPGIAQSIFARISKQFPHSEEGRGILNKALLFSNHLADDASSWHHFLASYFTEAQLRNVVKQKELIEENSPQDFFRNEYKRFSDLDSEAEQAMGFDARNYLPEDLLFKIDIASMMNSLECRSPFVDHKLAELTARIPMKHKLGRGESGKKQLLKSAFEEELPADVINHKKTGFGIPRSRWLRGNLKPLLENTLRSPSNEFSNLLNTDVVGDMIDAHISNESNYGAHLWALIILELWIREMDVKL